MKIKAEIIGKSSTEIADEIVSRWAHHEMGPLDVPNGRLWVLRQEIAEAIRAERRAARIASQSQHESQKVTMGQPCIH